RPPSRRRVAVGEPLPEPLRNALQRMLKKNLLLKVSQPLILLLQIVWRGPIHRAEQSRLLLVDPTFHVAAERLLDSNAGRADPAYNEAGAVRHRRVHLLLLLRDDGRFVITPGQILTHGVLGRLSRHLFRYAGELPFDLL